MFDITFRNTHFLLKIIFGGTLMGLYISLWSHPKGWREAILFQKYTNFDWFFVARIFIKTFESTHVWLKNGFGSFLIGMKMCSWSTLSGWNHPRGWRFVPRRWDHGWVLKQKNNTHFCLKIDFGSTLMSFGISIGSHHRGWR